MDWANVWLTDEMTDRLTDGQIKRMIDWLIDWPTSCRTDPLSRSRWSALRTFATSKIDVVKKFRFNHRQLHRLLPISERPSKMWAQCNLRKYVIFSILICSFNAASSSSHHGRGGWKGRMWFHWPLSGRLQTNPRDPSQALYFQLKLVNMTPHFFPGKFFW